MPKVVPTHINAYYADLIVAKQAAAEANQKVVLLEEQIKAMGGELASDEASVPQKPEEDTVTSEDVSAKEEKPAEKPKYNFSKKGDK